MKAILQFATTESGVYKDAGSERVTQSLRYKVEPITEKNKGEEPEIAAYKVKVETDALQLNINFQDQDTWWFRLFYPAELLEIKISQRRYILSYDGLIDKNGVQLHKIRMEFYIAIADYAAYTTPATAPTAQEGALVETTTLYIE